MLGAIGKQIRYILLCLLLSILISVSGCSLVCYDPGENSFSGTKVIKVPPVYTVSPEEDTFGGWVESDIILSAGQDFEVDIMGRINSCPPADYTNCSDTSEYCIEGALYPQRCTDALSSNGNMIKLDDKGYPICLAGEVPIATSLLFPKPVRPGDSIVVELVPLLTDIITEGATADSMSCDCLSKGNCSMPHNFIYYTTDYKTISGDNILYKAIEDSTSTAGAKCIYDAPLSQYDIYHICGYGDLLCFKYGADETITYANSLVVNTEENNKLWYGSKFNEVHYEAGSATSFHMPNFLATGDTTEKNGGILINYKSGDLRVTDFESTDTLKNFKCSDIYNSSSEQYFYTKQLSFYEANKICDKAVGVASDLSMQIKNNSAVLLPGRVINDPNRTDYSMTKSEKAVENGYQNFWIPSLGIFYNENKPTKLSGSPGMNFAPDSAATNNYLGHGYPYRIPSDVSSDEVWVKVAFNNSSGVTITRGGLLLRIKHYCIHDDGESMYAVVSDVPPTHVPGTESSDIDLTPKTTTNEDGVVTAEPIIISGGSSGGKVYFGIKDSIKGTQAQMQEALDTNNYYTISYYKQEWPQTVSKPINAVINFVKSQLFGVDPWSPECDPDDYSCTKDEGIIRPMYNIFAKKLYPLFIWLLIIYISIYGILFMMGMVQNPQYELILMVFKIGFIIACLSTNSWNFLAYNVYSFFIKGVTEILDSTTNSIVHISTDFTFLDQTVGTLFDMTTVLRIFSLVLAGPVGFMVWCIIIHGLVKYAGAMFKFVLQYIMIIFGFGWLIFLSPMFVMALMFGFTKDLFNNWIKLLVSFALQPLFMFTMVGMMNAIMLFSVNSLLSFGICGGQCALYIKLGEIGTQNVGFCLISFFLPQGYEASITAAQYMTSSTDPMVNFFGLPFGITMLVLFYLSTYSIGRLMKIAENMALVISGSMISMSVPAQTAVEALKWVVGADKQTRGETRKALKAVRKEGTKDAKDMEIKEGDDKKSLDDVNKKSREGITKNIKGDDSQSDFEIKKGDDEKSFSEAMKKTPEKTFASASKLTGDVPDYGDYLQDSFNENNNNVGVEDEPNRISQRTDEVLLREPPPDYDRAAEPDIPEPDYDDREEERIPPPDYDNTDTDRLDDEDDKYDDAENQRQAKRFDEYVRSGIKDYKDKTSRFNRDEEDE